MLGGDGPLCIAVLWSLTVVVFLFLGLRVYTRIVCVSSYGIDDHIYMFTWVLMVAFSSMITVAAHRGYGRDDLPPDEQVNATYFRMIAQTFSLVATGTSKASVGFFLLRLVVTRWQIISIWVVIVVIMVLSILNAFFTWLACKPLPFTYDQRVGGTCLNTIPSAITLAMGTIVVDIYFAVLPWVFIGKLNIPRRDKFTIASSLSLGLVAAVAGAFRVLAVKGVRDVPVKVIVWSQAETALTLICVSIPVLRPLWSKRIGKWFKSSKDGSFQYEADLNDGSGRMGLNTIGGGPMDGVNQSKGSGGLKRSKWAKFGMMTELSTLNRTRANDAHSDEIELTKEMTPSRGGDDNLGRDVEESWARGEGLTKSETGDGKAGIVTLKTYGISRSD